MGIQILGADGATPGVIDTLFQALRVSVRPTQVINWASVSQISGALANVAALGQVYSLRNTGTNLLMVRRMAIQAMMTASFAAAQKLDYGLYIARSITVAPSGGTNATNSSGKHRTSFATPNVESQIAAAVALTPGTASLDANAIGAAATWVPTGTVGNLLPVTTLFSHDTGDHPLILQAGEGIRLLNLTAMTGGGIVNLYTTVEFAEVASY